MSADFRDDIEAENAAYEGVRAEIEARKAKEPKLTEEEARRLEERHKMVKEQWRELGPMLRGPHAAREFEKKARKHWIHSRLHGMWRKLRQLFS